MADAKNLADAIEKRVDAGIEQQHKAQRTTTVIGVILTAVILGYFTFLNVMVRKLFTPESIAEVSVSYAVSELPKFSAEIRTEISGQAGTILNRVVDAGLDQLPLLRKEGESIASTKAKEYLSRIETDFKELTDYAYAHHGDEVRGLVQDLTTEEGTKALEDELYNMLTELFLASNVRSDLESFGLTLQGFNDKMLHLRDSADLSHEEQIERDILIVLKEFSDRSH